MEEPSESMLKNAKDLITFTPGGKTNVLIKTKKTVSDLTIKFADLIVAAFGIVSALSWNDSIKSLFTSGGMLERFNKGGPWVVSIVITLLALAIGYWRNRLLPPSNK